MEKKVSEIKDQVLKNSFWNFLSLLISRIGGIAFIVIVARMLLPEGFGLYSLATTIALTFLSFADMGINQTLIRYVSEEIDRNKKKAAAYFHYLFRIKLILSLIVSFLLLALSYPIAYGIIGKPELLMPLIILSFYTFILGIGGFLEYLFYARKKVVYISIKETLLQTTRFVLIFVFLVVLKYSIIGTIFCLIISLLIVLAYVFYILKKESPFLFEKTREKIDKRRVIRFLGFLTLGNLSVALFSSVNILLLGRFVSGEYIGYFSAALGIVMSLAMLLSISNVLLPVFTKIHGERLQKATNFISRYLFMITIPACIGLAFMSRYVIRLIYGYDYLPAAFPMAVLSFLIIPGVMVELFITLISAGEKSKDFAKAIGIVALISVALNYLLIKIFLGFSEESAVTGAALATLVSWIIYFVFAYFTVKKKLGILINYNCVIKPVISGLIMLAVLWYIRSFFADINLLNGILLVAIGTLAYLVSMFFMGGIKKDDIYMIKAISSKSSLKKEPKKL